MQTTTDFRYDFMEEAPVGDTDGELYPDFVSANFEEFRPRSTPAKLPMTEQFLRYFWDTVDALYGTPKYEDIILMYNRKGRVEDIQPGDILEFPARQDLEDFWVNNRVGRR